MSSPRFLAFPRILCASPCVTPYHPAGTGPSTSTPWCRRCGDVPGLCVVGRGVSFDVRRHFFDGFWSGKWIFEMVIFGKVKREGELGRWKVMDWGRGMIARDVVKKMDGWMMKREDWQRLGSPGDVYARQLRRVMRPQVRLASTIPNPRGRKTKASDRSRFALLRVHL